MFGASDSDSSDEEKQLNDLKQLEDEALQANQSPAVEPTLDISKLSPREQKRYENIRAAYGLNILLCEKLVKFEKQLVVRLKECREKLAALQVETNVKLPEKPQTFRYVLCGKPYFKDREQCPPPDNDDTITMASAGMFDFCEIQSVPGWTLKDKSQFIEQILSMSRKIRKAELMSKLAELKRKVKTEDCNEIKTEIVKLKRAILNVKNLPMEAVVKPVDEEYDWEAISDMLDHRHSPQEYRSIWKLFLHPAISKKSWSKTEHSKLQEIVHSFKLQDWDEIAKALDTGRTGYQCFVYYRTHMSNTFTGAKWTKEEEEYLSRLVAYYKEEDYIPWGKVAASMENRTKTQIYNKYFRMNVLRKGRFLAEEDAVLLTCIENFGPKWRQISNYLPGRSANQVRMRYQVLSSATRASVVWTAEEDRKLVQLMANQDTESVNYASLTQFFPGKDRVQLRARYTTLSRWMKRHPNKDISTAPRRGARRLRHGYGNQDLEKAVENLKKRIQSEVESVKSKKINKNSPEEDIEHAIVTTLITETIREEALKKQITESQSRNTAGENTATVNEKNLRSTLILLKARLRKELFKGSKYHKQYPRLEQEEIQGNSMTLKSYSKKGAVTVVPTTSFGAPVNIWDNPLQVTESVLPPNYSTITGCRRLLALASNANPLLDNRINIAQIMRRNSVAKEQIDLFMERFTTLFLWPILLSNENPKESNQKQPMKGTNHSISLVQEVPSDFNIPHVNRLKASATPDIVNDNIDLPKSNKDSDLDVKTCIGNDDFMYMACSSEEECPKNVSGAGSGDSV